MQMKRTCGTIAAALVVALMVWAGTGSAQSFQSTKKDSTVANANSDQKTEPVTTMSVKVNVVNVLATVRDKHGKIVNTLAKDDFTISEDGRPQTIHYFTRESDLPLTLGLMVDTSMSQRRVLDQEREPWLSGPDGAGGQGQSLRDSLRSGGRTPAGSDQFERKARGCMGKTDHAAVYPRQRWGSE
jgi:hypothetical protein